jgi:hypothetical protein
MVVHAGFGAESDDPIRPIASDHFPFPQKSRKLPSMKSEPKSAHRNGRTTTASPRAVVTRSLNAPAKSPAVQTLDAEALNARLLTGHQLSIHESGGNVVRCDVVGTNEQVPPDMFDDYLARGLIQEMEHSYRFGISNDGRRRLR